jgi:hypothetical protein
MVLISAKTDIGTVINLKGLIEQMEELEYMSRREIGEMHYSICWKELLKSLKEYDKEVNKNEKRN